MSIVRCPECQKEISSEAKTCPNCGYPTQEAKLKSRVKTMFFKYGLWVVLPLIIIAAITLIVLFCHTNASPAKNTPDGNSFSAITPETEVMQLYYDYFGKKYGWDNEKIDPMCSDYPNKYNVFLADLTHDGVDEMIVLNDTLDYEEEVELTVYTYKQGEIEPIYTDRSTKMPRDKTFGLYYADQLTYLIVCFNDFWMTGGTLSYEVFQLSEYGEKKCLINDTYSETIDPENYDESDPGYYSFLDRQEKVLNKSKILFQCDSGYVCQSDPKDVLSGASDPELSALTE